jgi:hypothetical protein
MSKTIIAATNNSTMRELAPAGTHIARCISIIDIGTQEIEWKGQHKLSRRILIVWELPNETKIFREEFGEQPFLVTKELTLSLGEKATLRKILESWRGKSFTEDEAKGFDISVLLNKPCLITIIHKISKISGNSYCDISSVTMLPKEMKCPDRIMPLTCVSLESPLDSDYDKLPDWIKEKIKKSLEYQKLETPQTIHSETEEDDELPF